MLKLVGVPIYYLCGTFIFIVICSEQLTCNVPDSWNVT